MVTSFREIFITFSLIGVFIFSMMSFIVVMQVDNDVEEGILSNPIINSTYTKLETNLTNFRSETQTQRESFEGEIPERGFGSLIIFSIVGIGQKFTGLIVGIYNIFIVLPASILGISPVVISVLTSILLVTIVLLIWRVYRVGG